MIRGPTGRDLELSQIGRPTETMNPSFVIHGEFDFRTGGATDRQGDEIRYMADQPLRLGGRGIDVLLGRRIQFQRFKQFVGHHQRWRRHLDHGFGHARLD